MAVRALGPYLAGALVVAGALVAGAFPCRETYVPYAAAARKTTITNIVTGAHRSSGVGESFSPRYPIRSPFLSVVVDHQSGDDEYAQKAYYRHHQREPLV